jgi:hypothetical protein
MIYNSKTARIMNKQKKDFWTEENIENRIEDIERIIAEYESEGYSVQSVAGSADIPVITGKKIIVWSSTPSGTKSVATSAISGATSVIITGVVRINAGYIYTSHTDTLTFTFTSSGNYDKVTFRWIDFQVGTAGLTNLRFLNSNIRLLGNSVKLTYSIAELKDTKISCVTATVTAGGDRTIDLTFPGGSEIVENCRFTLESGATYIYGIAITATADLTFKNCIIKDFDSADWGHSVANPSNINYLNCKLENSPYFNPDVTKTTEDYILYTDTWTFEYPNTNYRIKPYLEGQQIIDGEWKLTTSTISATGNYFTTDFIITSIKRTYRKLYGDIKTQFYSLSFQDNRKIDDSLKYFDDTDYFILWRKDIEDGEGDLFSFLNSGNAWVLYQNYIVSGSIYPYRNDESFLFWAKTSGGVEAVLAWHKGRIYSTAFSEYYPHLVYVPIRCFNILEIPEEVSGIQNTWTYQDAPLSGSITLRDITSKVVRS